MNLALEDRQGLPDALRVLLEDYPRAGWESDPGFDGLIRFWLDRHLMFRRIMSEMTHQTEALLDNRIEAMAFGQAITRMGGMFVNGLHEHHTVEDQHYFPRLVQKDDRLEKGFDILDADHHALDRHLADFVDGANDALKTLETPEALRTSAGRFHDQLQGLTGLLDRHLTDEEDLIVPILLVHGSPD